MEYMYINALSNVYQICYTIYITYLSYYLFAQCQ